jgi:phenylacetate-CoA ligase
MKSIYSASPRVLRTVYTNAYGLNTRLRHHRWEQLLREHAYTETLDRSGQIALVEGKLKQIIRHAIANVPFYAQYHRLLADLEHISAYEVLKELPITNKEFINHKPEAFLARGRGKCVISRTSGTTGTPFLIHMEKPSFLLGDALWWRRTLWAGYKSGDWIARLVGDPIVPLHEKNPTRPWIVSYPDRRIYLSTFHLNADTAQAIGELLRRRRPAYVMGYPSSLEILCSYLKDSGFRMDWDLRNVLFSSEPMHAHQEQIITEILRAKICGLYGSGEKVISAAQCAAGRYHLSLIDGYLEGQFGIMEEVKPAAVTTLSNFAMPMIRYQIGDMIEAQPSLVCECGRTLPVISPVITKHEDWIITPTGRRISPSAVVWAFIHQDIKDIRNGQVVQENEHLVRVYLNADEDTFLKYREVLRQSMRMVFFEELDVEVVRTDQIEVTRAGKSRFIFSKLRQPV